ncbi:MAG: ankyrin repeat domain-containing protein [Myxococcaceae bacterium]
MASLFEAVAAGDAEAVVEALEAGDDVNASGDGGRTPLIEAARLGHADVVELLLEAGAVAFIKDDEQETALLKAAANGHHDCCELLFQHSDEEERQMASAFLRASGKTHGPPREKVASKFTQRVARLGARAAKFVGHERLQERIERVDRAEENDKKRR